MKNILITLSIAAYVLIATSFSNSGSGTIKGMVSPANAGSKAIAMSRNDTAQSNIYQGMFQLTGLQPGTYSVTIEAVPPYKNVSKKLIVVTEGATTDIGYFFLKK